MRNESASPSSPRAPSRTSSTASSSGAKFYHGKGLQLPLRFTASHQTENLAGYPAYDFMAPAGTPVYAPFSGTVTRLSGHQGGSAGHAAGRSIYLKGAPGTAFLTHFDYDKTIVKEGQKIKKGQLIGYVMAYPGGANHIHFGLNRS